MADDENKRKLRAIVVREYDRLVTAGAKADDATWERAARTVWERSVEPVLEQRRAS